ncbi:unnamed protein product [Orchesella dallaii]|uniref:CUB domain-containing protein n=1 Tax=Orchesella dallaii TaxID=48710 RepID=A0ABP1S8G3_9HEXA
MKYFSIILGTVLALALTVSAETVLVNPSKPIKSSRAESSLRCGGVLNGAEGGISYKPYESILPNERCVWTVQANNAEGYNLNILRLGSEEGTEITASCVKGPWAMWSYPVSSTGEMNRTISECPVLVITLYSTGSSQTARGFILEYEAKITSGSNKISTNSRQQITNAESGHIRYPGNGLNYTNSEVSTFVFAPKNNIYAARKNASVIFVEDWLDDVHCYDTIHVFHLKSVTGERRVWDWASAVCPGTDMMELSNHDDLILVVFLTDENRTGSGFHLIHSRK